MPEILQRFVREELGVTAVEYALVAALIAVVIINSVAAVGSHLKNTFSSVTGSL